MINTQDLLGSLLQAGATRSGETRVRHAMSEEGLGGANDILGQLLGGAGSGGSILGNLGLGGLGGKAQEMLGGATRSVKQGNPLAIGGLAALAGAFLGGGSGAMKGALGGGALALLGSLAYSVMTKDQNPQGAAPAAGDLPLGLREPEDSREEKILQDRADVLLLAIVNAMKADGVVDGEELSRLSQRLNEVGADQEARDYILDQLRRPIDLDGLIRAVPDKDTGVQAYAASLLAIEVDTDAEKTYLRALARGLGLTSDMVAEIHRRLGVTATVAV